MTAKKATPSNYIDLEEVCGTVASDVKSSIDFGGDKPSGVISAHVDSSSSSLSSSSSNLASASDNTSESSSTFLPHEVNVKGFKNSKSLSTHSFSTSSCEDLSHRENNRHSSLASYTSSSSLTTSDQNLSVSAIENLLPRVTQNTLVSKNVLSEEDYIDSLSTIIERDFYPDLPRLRTLYNLQCAEEKGDYYAIQRYKNELVALTPVTQFSDATPRKFPFFSVQEEEAESFIPSQLPSVDQFLANYTSEDNASFNELMKKEKETRDNSLIWMEETASLHNQKMNAILNNIKESKKTDDLISNKFEAKNALFFFPEDVVSIDSFSKKLNFLKNTENLAIGDEGNRINKSSIACLNTRFTSAEQKKAEQMSVSQMEKRLRAEDEQRCEKNRDEMIIRGSGFVEDHVADKLASQREKLKNDQFMSVEMKEAMLNHLKSKSVQLTPYTRAGYLHGDPKSSTYKTTDNFVQTPNLIPGVGVDSSPLMTWGEIASTPLLLDEQSEISLLGGRSLGPNEACFKLPDPLLRERVAETLKSTASERIRKRKLKQVKQQRCSELQSPFSSNDYKSRMQAIVEKSPLIAQVLKSQSKNRLNVDLALRAAYSGRKYRRTGELSTPHSFASVTPRSMNSPLSIAGKSPYTIARDQSDAESDSTAKSLGVAYTAKHVYNENSEKSRVSKDSNIFKSSRKNVTDDLLA